MIKYAEQISRLESLAKETGAAIEGGSFILASVALKRAADLAVELRTTHLIGAANREWMDMSAQPGAKMEVNGAVLKKYTYPVKYTYPDEIVQLEAQLSRMKKAAEASGAARLVPRNIDPEKDTMFTIS